MTAFDQFLSLTLSSAFGLISGIFMYVGLRPSFSRYATRRLVGFRLRHWVQLWSIYILAGGVATVLGNPLVVSLKIPSQRILASFFPTTLALGVAGLIRFLVVERSQGFANTLILWIPASLSILVFVSINTPDLIQQLFDRIIIVKTTEIQMISLMLFGGSWCMLVVSELLAWFATRDHKI